MTKTSIDTPEEEPERSIESVSITFRNGSTFSSNGSFTFYDRNINATNVGDGVISASKMTGSITSSKILDGSIQAHQLPPTSLFGTWIRDTKELQEQYYGKKFEDFDHQELVEWVRINILAAEDELHETLGEISWKPWAKSEFFNREAYLGELVDVLHFVGNLLAGAGITDEELNAAYLEKMERNRERQRSNYTGLDKCTKCKRAVDDIQSHGGRMVQGDGRGKQWCDACLPRAVTPGININYAVDKPCSKCGKIPSEIPGYYFRFWVSNENHPTVHSTGYGCNSCFCDPGDDWK